MVNKYTPQKRLKEIGEEGQKKLSEAKILIVGCGALGSPVAMYLAGAGVGNIFIADFDTLDASNLHRQVFYREEEVGLGKAEILRQRMVGLNSEVAVSVVPRLITPTLLESLDVDIDVIVDAADNPSTTYLLDSYCRMRNIPLVIGGVSGWDLQVFCAIPGSFSYADVFPRPDDSSGILPCSIAGIVGPCAGAAASIQAAEVIKIVTGCGSSKSFLLTGNLLSSEFNRIC